MSHRVAADVPSVELESYQRAVRLVLRHPLITEKWPDAGALSVVRRWFPQLARDLETSLGYRLDLTAGCARLMRTLDDLDDGQGAMTAKGRAFDRQRYVYLCLVLAAVGTRRNQTTLNELAQAVAADAAAIAGHGFDPKVWGDRRAFVDILLWLEERGALRLADGSSGGWVDDPDAGDALYDIDHLVVDAVCRPGRILQHVTSVKSLLAPLSLAVPGALSSRRQAALKARRALVERPVVYTFDVGPEVGASLQSAAVIEDVERLTGLVVERRAEGLALVDSTGRWSDQRFPATGVVGQAALLLIRDIAERIEHEPDIHRLALEPAADYQRRLRERIDAAVPRSGLVEGMAWHTPPPPLPLPVSPPTYGAAGAPAGAAAADDADDGADVTAPADCPFVERAWLQATIRDLIEDYAGVWGAAWREDPGHLLDEAIAQLAAFRMVERVAGGVVVLPLLARYRDALIHVAPSQRLLFAPPPRARQGVRA